MLLRRREGSGQVGVVQGSPRHGLSVCAQENGAAGALAGWWVLLFYFFER